MKPGASTAGALTRSRPGRSRPARLLRSTRAALLAPLYAAYTRQLRDQVERSPLPAHVAVILDGNRRWANAAGHAEVSAGHRAGADKLDELIDWCVRIGVGQVTVWALSQENLTRPPEQLGGLLDVVADKLDALAELHRGQSLQIRVVGRHDGLPSRLRASIGAVEAATAANTGLRLTIALAYSGRDELVDAARSLVRRLAEEGASPELIAKEITRDALAQHLYTAGVPDPDLIIRTSGELRLSGFLPWQGTDSELYFTDVYWPAFRELDFLRALRSFQQRRRRFGR
jgi:short-chain Z-isoprenyl diphosphate synthase